MRLPIGRHAARDLLDRDHATPALAESAFRGCPLQGGSGRPFRGSTRERAGALLRHEDAASVESEA